MRGQISSDSFEPTPESPVQDGGEQARKPWIAPEFTTFDAVNVTRGIIPNLPGDGFNNMS